MNEFRDAYQAQVRANAKAFARSLKAQGIQVEGDERDGFTETHQVLIRVKMHGPGQAIARRLEENNIVVNYQALPDDETFLESSGVRLGVQEMTRFGMTEKDFEVLAGYLADVVIRNTGAKDEVAKYRRGFPGDEILPAAGGGGAARREILKSVFPRPGLIDSLAENLLK